jgi:hypothetical protein
MGITKDELKNDNDICENYSNIDEFVEEGIGKLSVYAGG